MSGVTLHIAWIALYLLVRMVMPHVRLGAPIVEAVAGAIVLMLLSLAVIVSAARMEISKTIRVAIAVGALALWIGLLFARVPRMSALSYLMDVALITCATHFGVLVASVVKEPKLLLPVALCAALVDIWGVNLAGPVKIISQKAPKVLEKTTATVPAFGSAKIEKGRKPPPPMLVGFGDFLFLGIFFACLVRFGMNVAASFWLTAMFTIVALIVVGMVDRLLLPGLPFMAVGVILPNIGFFRFTREERFALLYATIALGVVLTGAFVISGKLFS